MASKVISTRAPVLIILILLLCFTSPSQNASAQNGYPPPATVGAPNQISSMSNRVFIPAVMGKSNVPQPSLSIYVDSAHNLSNLGEFHGKRDALQTDRNESFIVLNFGKVSYTNNTYGATNWHGTSYSINNLKTMAQSFAAGYISGLQGRTGEKAVIILGTNNSDDLQEWWLNLEIRHQVYEHGKNWAMLINELNNWAINVRYQDRITFVGGMDIESDWSSYEAVETWAYAYAMNTYQYLWNFGTATCPVDYPSANENGYHQPAHCSNGWYQDDIYNISHGNGFTRALPEIYVLSSAYYPEANARQWFRVGLIGIYNYPNHPHMFFEGVMTQYNACHYDLTQMNPECISFDTYNTASDGYLQMAKWLDNDGPGGVENKLRYSTDIWWFEGIIPADWRLP